MIRIHGRRGLRHTFDAGSRERGLLGELKVLSPQSKEPSHAPYTSSSLLGS